MLKILSNTAELVEEEGGRPGVEGLLQFNYPKAATEHSLRTLTEPYRTVT